MATRFFDDGDILVYASSAPDTVLGKVHEGVLRAYPDSPFGEALEARDDPGNKIRLAYEPSEIEALIDGAYDGRLLRFDRFNPRTFDRSVPLLDVAERHDLESLRTAMLGCLESDCPQSLADWDALTNSITTSSMTVTRTGGFLDDLVLEPVLAISRARRFGLYSLLPPLFAMLAQFSERWHWDDHFSTAAAALPSYHPSRWHIRHRGARWDLLDDEDVQHLGGVRAYLGPKVAAFRLHISFPGTPALIEVSHGACATALSLLITPDELDDLCIHHDPLLGWRVLSERAQSPQSGLCDACTARLTAFATHSREEIWTHLAQPHPAAPTEPATPTLTATSTAVDTELDEMNLADTDNEDDDET